MKPSKKTRYFKRPNTVSVPFDSGNNQWFISWLLIVRENQSFGISIFRDNFKNENSNSNVIPIECIKDMGYTQKITRKEAIKMMGGIENFKAAYCIANIRKVNQ